MTQSISRMRRDDDMRDRCMFLHRQIALLAVLQCWRDNLDGIIFQHAVMTRLFTVEALRKTRVDMFRQDIKDFFLFNTITACYRLNRKHRNHDQSFMSVWAARCPFEKQFSGNPMPDEERIHHLTRKGIRFGIFTLWPDIYSDVHASHVLLNTPLLGYAENSDRQILDQCLYLFAQGKGWPKLIPELIDSVKKKSPDNLKP